MTTITTTTTVTVPPNTFQVQYWYFGVTVNLIILCIILGFYMQNTHERIGSDGFIFMGLIGLLVGGIVALLMNVYPWEIIAVEFLILIVYIIRQKG